MTKQTTKNNRYDSMKWTRQSEGQKTKKDWFDNLQKPTRN